MGELGAGADQVLAVIQDQQQLFGLHKAQQRLKQRLGRRRMQAKRLRDDLRHKRRLAQRREIHQPDAIRKRVAYRCWRSESQAVSCRSHPRR